jgi:Rrf2 family protein
MATLQISRKLDYALRALIHLTEHHDKRTCTLGHIAAHTAVSSRFLAKIVEELVHRNIVRSRRGPRGGYRLARPAADITIRDVIEAVEGPIAINSCVGEHDDCVQLATCAMAPVWQQAQRRLDDLFAGTTLADLRLRHRSRSGGKERAA